MCFAVNNTQDELSAFVITISESEKYDKLIQSTWISQLYQKYPNVDQVKENILPVSRKPFTLFKNFFELNECHQWIYDEYPVRVQLFVDLTIRADNAYFIGNKLMKIIIDNLIKRGSYYNNRKL